MPVVIANQLSVHLLKGRNKCKSYNWHKTFFKTFQMKDKKPSNHHVVPRSKRGKTLPDNLATIEKGKHLLYHELFENRTPVEILEYLVNYFWRSQDGQNGIRFINKFLKI
jgi:hypothetical protein